MVITRFPPVESADPSGLLAVGGDLEPESLLRAYSLGIFPWPPEEDLLAWFAPPLRAVAFLPELHFSRRLRRESRTGRFKLTIDRDFPSVIRACAEAGDRAETGTWITGEMIDAYIELHELGYAHSIECWYGEELAGGLYGVSIGRLFCAESMFHKRSNTSKLCLLHLTEFLSAAGVEWFDCQIQNPFLASLGVREIPREDYARLLNEALRPGLPPLFRPV